MVAETQTGIDGLTKMDLVALREADRVVFTHGPEGGAVKAIKHMTGSPWKGDAEYSISVHSAIDCLRADTHYSWAFEMISGAELSRLWRTIVDHLRPGDDVRLLWMADNTSITMDETGLTMDELHVVVWRGKTRHEYALEWHVAERFSSSRMIRP